MHQASLTVDPAFWVSNVDPRLYGSFVEHMGRCVYTGIYEPEHPSADEAGFRTDSGGGSTQALTSRNADKLRLERL